MGDEISSAMMLFLAARMGSAEMSNARFVLCSFLKAHYDSLVGAGFSEEQALALTASLQLAMLKGKQEAADEDPDRD